MAIERVRPDIKKTVHGRKLKFLIKFFEKILLGRFIYSQYLAFSLFLFYLFFSPELYHIKQMDCYSFFTQFPVMLPGHLQVTPKHCANLTRVPLPAGGEIRVTDDTSRDSPLFLSPLISSPFCEGPLL